jgi:uncharacterized membrane protein
MKNKRRILFLILSLTAVLALAGTVLAAQTGVSYNITRWTVDGGGGRLTGGGYTLTGTVGQPEPGPALSGGGYTLTSGFWPGGGSSSSSGYKIYLPLVMK